MKQFLKRIIVAVITLEARILLWRAKPKIIAITGNVGKTSTKDAVYAVVKQKVRARKSDKSYNTELGVPLTVLGLPNAYRNIVGWLKNAVDGLLAIMFPGTYPEWLVLEVGVDRPGDMEMITRWLTPDIVVLTRLPTTPVHVEYFDSPEDVVAEKQKLVEALKPDGVLIYNHDDERVRQIADEVPQQTIGYSRYSASPFKTSDDVVRYENGVPTGVDFVLTHGDDSVDMHVKGSLGVQDTYNYAAATAVGSHLGVTLEEARLVLNEYTPPAGRMRLIPGIKNTVIIDASYNSSPVALERSLQSLKELNAKRKIAVLGDMLELGQYSTREHEKAGVLAKDAADLLLTVGVRARGIAEGALEAGMSEKCILQYEAAERAGRELQNMLQEGDVVLIKGSQSIRMEKIVEEIMAYPEEASKLLVRQDAFWKKN